MKVFKISIVSLLLSYDRNASAYEHRELMANATSITNNTTITDPSGADSTPVAAPEDDTTTTTPASTNNPSSTDNTGDDS